MDERQYLDSSLTPRAILNGRRGLTRLQLADFSRGILEKWIRIEGRIYAITDNGPLSFFGVTVVIPDPWSAIDIFCAFFGDRERLKLATTRDIITAEGRIVEISRGSMKLESCTLLNPSTGEPFAERFTLEDFKASLIASHEAFELANEPRPPRIELQPEPDIIAPRTAEHVQQPIVKIEERKPIPQAALLAWHKAFLIAYPNGNQTLALKSATGAFPNHAVSRQRVRDLFPEVPRGRPVKTKD